jgi:hypothetical protein
MNEIKTPYYNSEVRLEPSILVMDAQDSTGFGTGLKVEQFTNVMFETFGADSADGTLNVYVSYQDEEPDWDSPDIDNRIYPVACLDLDAQGAIITGTTGVTVADGGKHYIVSAQGFRWINFEFTRTAGEVSVWVNPYDNQ